MDHVIEYILEYMQMEVESFRSEWNSGNYSKISECPTYPCIKAYCDAIKALNTVDGRYSGYTPKNFLIESDC